MKNNDILKMDEYIKKELNKKFSKVDSSIASKLIIQWFRLAFSKKISTKETIENIQEKILKINKCDLQRILNILIQENILSINKKAEYSLNGKVQSIITNFFNDYYKSIENTPDIVIIWNKFNREFMINCMILKEIKIYITFLTKKKPHLKNDLMAFAYNQFMIIGKEKNNKRKERMKNEVLIKIKKLSNIL